MNVFANFGSSIFGAASCAHRRPCGKPLHIAGAYARNGVVAFVFVFAMAFAGLSLAAFGAEPALARGPGSLASLAAQVSEAVVNISATQTFDQKQASNMPPGTPFDRLFRQFMKRHHGDNGPLPPMREHGTNSLGSGFVIDPSGIIITNNHVIADANDITVIFADGTKLKAKVVGKDSKVDVAVLKVNPKKPLKAVKFGDSNKMHVGDWVMAVGNPFGLGGSVTAGIISARNRNIDSGPYDDYFQTDAAINKGNSGGPLFNMDGEVIGINTAILSPSGGSIGIGFATPSDIVVPIIKQLEKYGVARRGWLGVRIQNVDDTIAQSLGLGTARGALVAGTDANGPARAAGIKTGDVIVKFGDKTIKEAHDLPAIVAGTPVGENVAVVVIRHGKELTKTVKLGLLQSKKLTLAAAAPHRAPLPAPVQKAMGMTFSRLTQSLRLRFAIKQSVKGVVVTDVDPNSAAADKHIQAGETIEEVDQDPVKSPADVTAKLQALKKAGKKLALLLIATPRGDVRFVAVAMQ